MSGQLQVVVGGLGIIVDLRLQDALGIGETVGANVFKEQRIIDAADVRILLQHVVAEFLGIGATAVRG